jgi:glycosyltransferase involved in cell wall biosynthesis
LGSRAENDLSRAIWRRKRKSLESLAERKFRVVTPSRWLAEQARKSTLLGRFPCSVIPYGLDIEVFQPRDPRLMREALGIPLTAKVVLFLADGVDDPRKGREFLLRALEGMADSQNLFLLTLGRGGPLELGAFPHVHVNAVADDRLLSCVYSAADVFVAPSLQDNLPNTVLEAIACGVPVVGFASGGIPDAVRQGETGLLAPLRDVRGLREAVRELLATESIRTEMARNCRRVAVQEYALEIQARRYLELYRAMISGAEHIPPKSPAADSNDERHRVTEQAAP